MKILGKILFFLLLTLLTQIGGVVLLLVLSLYPLLPKFKSSLINGGLKLGIFLLFYSLSTFLLVPMIAPQFGRVPLPVREHRNLKPLSILTPFLNRHYLRPELKRAAEKAAIRMHKKFPGTTVNYLDANFPFLHKFPLFPHLSHNDGKKLDLAFLYDDQHTGLDTNEAPSFIGYGVCEDPLKGEENTAQFCTTQGYWQYSFLTAVVPQDNKPDFSFDAERTTALVNFLSSTEAIGKIFIEPHLKKRLGLKSDKIRFHGCQAVRHDDHIHVQLK